MDVVVVYLIFWIFMLGLAVIIGVAWWKIFSKAGYFGAFGLLMLVPIANIILLLWFAFTEWPVVRQARSAEKRRDEY